MALIAAEAQYAYDQPGDQRFVNNRSARRRRRGRGRKYLSDFFGTKTLTAAEAEQLNTDPYMLKVSNQKTQNPYDFYWGGFNTITGGRGGPAGTDGWYFYSVGAGSSRP